MSRTMRLMLAATAFVPLLATAAPLAAPVFTAVDIEERNTGTFYVGGAIEGIGDLKLLVDTGSSYLVITQDMLDQLKEQGRAKYSRNLEGRMADGSARVIPVYQLSGLRIGDSCWVHDVEAAVFPSGSRPILGMNALSRLAPFTFSARPAQLGLSNCEKALPPPLQQEAAAKSSDEDPPLAAAESAAAGAE